MTNLVWSQYIYFSFALQNFSIKYFAQKYGNFLDRNHNLFTNARSVDRYDTDTQALLVHPKWTYQAVLGG